MISPTPASSDSHAVRIRSPVHIPMRDGVELGGTLYLPKLLAGPVPVLFTHTPYVADSFYGAGIYFAARGLPFLVVDCRGRGHSDGQFRPFWHDADDGHDIVEWLAVQDFCNGKVGMGGGSYSGFNQWAAAGRRPPHLVSMMPRCSSYPGVDFPIRNNIGEQYSLQWLAYVAGPALQSNLFNDWQYWRGLSRDRYVAGAAFRTLPSELGTVQPDLAEWLSHPEPDAYWDALTPSPEDYAAMTLPVLTVTGAYDDDQQGALEYYRAAMRHGSQALIDNQYLIIGPWDHGGVGAPQPGIGGVRFGPASLLDLRALSIDWYRWTMADGPRPAFLQDRVAYYVTGTEAWRYASSLEAVTAVAEKWHLDASNGPASLAAPGDLSPAPPPAAASASYRYDPRDTSNADLELKVDPFDPTDTQMLVASDGKQLVFETVPFAERVEIAGFFALDAWLSIDQPDTDFRVLVHAVAPDGSSILLTNDTMRARYADGLREPRLIESAAPRRFRFERFWFTARRLNAGDRLRLVIGAFDTIHSQKNYNAGGRVAYETLADARVATVKLLTGPQHASVLHVPIGKADEHRGQDLHDTITAFEPTRGS